MEGRVTPPERITSPTRGLPPPCKQPLTLLIKYAIYRGHNRYRRIPITGGRTPIESFIQQLAACLALKMWGTYHVKSEKFHVIYTEKRKFKRNELRPSCSGKLIVVAVQLLFDNAFAFEISYIFNDLNLAG